MQQAIQTSEFRQFWQNQIRQVQAGGWPVFFRKVRLLARRFLFLIGIFAAAPLVLIIVAIRPLVLFRFGTMRSERIGHFAGEGEAYLCIRDRDKPSRRTVDMIGCPEPVCNHQLQKMFARTKSITPGAELWSLLDRACQLWTRGDKHHINLNWANNLPEYRLLFTTKPHLSFTEEEKLRGRQLLEHLGIPADATWICIHNRDSAYLDKALGGCWAYHDYRDFSVQTMVSAAEELTQRGYYVLRMGSIVAAPLVSTNPKIIDYATSPLRSDFADIYLMAKSIAYLGSDSGIAVVTYIFRKPLFYINFVPVIVDIVTLSCPWPVIMKRLWCKKKQRFLSLREIFEMGLAGAGHIYVYEKAGVELVCNTPEEILALAVEVDERLKGNWQPPPGDEELQQRFWDTFRKYTPAARQSNIQARIGAAFLRDNIYLLD